MIKKTICFERPRTRIPCALLILSELSNLRCYQVRIHNIENEGSPRKKLLHCPSTTQAKIALAEKLKMKEFMTIEIEEKTG